MTNDTHGFCGKSTNPRSFPRRFYSGRFAAVDFGGGTWYHGIRGSEADDPYNCLMPSGGDKAVLEQFPQKTSVIYNSKGQYATFEKEV